MKKSKSSTTESDTNPNWKKESCGKDRTYTKLIPGLGELEISITENGTYYSCRINPREGAAKPDISYKFHKLRENYLTTIDPDLILENQWLFLETIKDNKIKNRLDYMFGEVELRQKTGMPLNDREN